jgi:hypothetical protein
MKLIEYVLCLTLILNPLAGPAFATPADEVLRHNLRVQLDPNMPLVEGSVYNFSVDGNVVPGVFVGMVPDPKSGNLVPYFEQIPGNSNYDPSAPAAPAGPGSSSTSSNPNPSAGTTGSGLSKGDAAGFAGVAISAGNTFNGILGANSKAAEGLRNEIQNDISTGDFYVDAAREGQVQAEKNAISNSGRAGAYTGAVSKSIKNTIFPNGAPQRGLPKEAECSIAVDKASLADMPAAYLEAMARGDVAVLAKYVELTYGDESKVTDFCLRNIKSLTDANRLIKIATIRGGLQLKNPLEFAELKTEVSTHQGALVRRVANRYLVEWSETNGLETYRPAQLAAYNAGLSQVLAADKDFVSGRSEVGFIRLKAAEWFLRIANGFLDGLSGGIKEVSETLPALGEALQKMAYEVSSDPFKAVEYAEKAFLSIPEVLKQAEDYILLKSDLFLTGNAYQRSKVIGEISVDVTVGWLTGGAVKYSGGVFRAATQSGGRLVGSFNSKASKWVLDEYGLSVRGRMVKQTSPLIDELSRMSTTEILEVRKVMKASPRLINEILDKNPSQLAPLSKLANDTRSIQIRTPYGAAKQEMSFEALEARQKLNADPRKSIYRTGTRGEQLTVTPRATGQGPQYWSLENPQTPGFNDRYAIYSGSSKQDFIERGELKPGADFVTRRVAPVVDGVATDGSRFSAFGGGIEVITTPVGVKATGHVSLD